MSSAVNFISKIANPISSIVSVATGVMGMAQKKPKMEAPTILQPMIAQQTTTPEQPQDARLTRKGYRPIPTKTKTFRLDNSPVSFSLLTGTDTGSKTDIFKLI